MIPVFRNSVLGPVDECSSCFPWSPGGHAASPCWLYSCTSKKARGTGRNPGFCAY